MPTREEIAAWLREAGRVEVALARMSGACKGAEDFSSKWEQRAAQVEAMRCETCKWWRSSDGEIGDCSIYGMPDECTSQFGCFAHEQKGQQ